MNPWKQCKHCCSKELVNLRIKHQNDFLVEDVATHQILRMAQLPQLLPVSDRDGALQFTLCVSCGQILGKWRLSVPKIVEALDGDYEIL